MDLQMVLGVESKIFDGAAPTSDSAMSESVSAWPGGVCRGELGRDGEKALSSPLLFAIIIGGASSAPTPR